MQCPFCKKNSVLIMNRMTDQGWSTMYYCTGCSKPVYVTAEPCCPQCGRTFSELSSTGFAGCSECYTCFHNDILRMLGRSYGVIPMPDASALRYWDTLASARTEEIREFVFSGEKIHYMQQSGKNKEFMTDFRSDFPPDKIFLGLRIRMARNVRGLPYFPVLTEDHKKKLGIFLTGQASAVHLGISHALNADLREAVFLTEDFPWFLSGEGIFSAVIYGSGRLSVYCGDEDHLRTQWIVPLHETDEETGDFRMFLKNQIREGMELMLGIHRLFLWQTHPSFGFLTASPANSGSGFRISMLLSLPALFRNAAERASWSAALKRQGFEIRGNKGEGSPVGTVIQISDRILTKESDPVSAAMRILLVSERLAGREKKIRQLT